MTERVEEVIAAVLDEFPDGFEPSLAQAMAAARIAYMSGYETALTEEKEHA